MPRETDITHIAGTEVLTATAGVLPVSLSSDIQIGAVELKNATTDDRAKIAATGSVAEGDNALAVQAPVLGMTTDAAVTTDAAGTLQQYLRGLVVHLVALLARIPVIGPQLAAASMSITPATDAEFDVSLVDPADTVLLNAVTLDASRTSAWLDLKQAGKVSFEIETAGGFTHEGTIYFQGSNTGGSVSGDIDTFAVTSVALIGHVHELVGVTSRYVRVSFVRTAGLVGETMTVTAHVKV